MIIWFPPPPRQPSLRALALGGLYISPDVKGNFTITGVRCLPAELMLNRLDPPYYIKEFRIDGIAVSGRREFAKTSMPSERNC